jgi:hypothetical protein
MIFERRAKLRMRLVSGMALSLDEVDRLAD